MKHSLTYDHYFVYDEISDALHAWAENSRYAKLEILGTSEEGRDILLISITDTTTGAYEDKPAYYVEGNIHAGEVTGSMTVMYLIDTIMSNLDEPEIAKILEKKTFYLLPRVSPDGAEYYLTTPGAVRSVNRPYPYDKQQPGLVAKDMDGDGKIRVMRVKTPFGIWKENPDDPRLMIRRQPDDTEGDFYNVYSEGEITGDDLLSIKDAPPLFSRDFNRNYPLGWVPEWEQRGAGETPLAQPETQANAHFLLTHKNVCSCVDMHTHGGMILYTPGYKSASKADPQDIALYRALGQMAAEESGYPLMNVYDGFMPQSNPVTYGGFDDFCHFLVGIPAFTIECWDIRARAGIKDTYPPKEQVSDEEQLEDAKKILAWIDEHVPESWQPWTPFVHPQLGEVEIGGIESKFIMQNPPVPYLEQELDKHVRFMLREVKTLPDIRFESVCAKKIAPKIVKVEAVVSNYGFMPTYVFKEATKNPALKPIEVTLSGNLTPVEGKLTQSIGQLGGLSSIGAMGWSLPATSMEREPLRKKASWVVETEAEVLVLTAQSDRAGRIETTVKVTE